MLSPPTCAASSRRRRRLTSASASARSTRIAASLSGPSDATLCKVTVFFDAMRSTSPEPVLFVEPYVFHSQPVIDAVDHRRVALDIDMPTGPGAVMPEDRAC